MQIEKYEVVLTIMEPYTPEVRMPPLSEERQAANLAFCLKQAYESGRPLVEIAHNGMRRGV